MVSLGFLDFFILLIFYLLNFIYFYLNFSFLGFFLDWDKFFYLISLPLFYSFLLKLFFFFDYLDTFLGGFFFLFLVMGLITNFYIFFLNLNNLISSKKEIVFFWLVFIFFVFF